jgi:acetyl esterase/lipase
VSEPQPDVPEDRSVFTRVAPEPTNVIPYGTDKDQIVEIFGSLGPIIGLVHGGYWRPEFDRVHGRPFAAAMSRVLGVRVANIEYRRIPGNPDSSIDDVISAVTLLNEMNNAPILLVGHSAGGHLALCTHAHAGIELRGVIALAPISNIVMSAELNLDDSAVNDFLGGAAHERPDLDPQHLYSLRQSVDPSELFNSVTVIHGTRDIRVPVEMSREFAKEKLIELVDIGHFELIDPESEVFPVVLGEVQRMLTNRD